MSELTDAIDRIVRKISVSEGNGGNTMDQAKARGARPASESSAVEAAPASKGSGGVNSPLTETAYSDREFFADVDVPSSDGIFLIRVAQIKTMKFTDAQAQSVVFNFKARP